ncbi:hypothetical protein JQ544_14565 [Bradyrhizobium diazoefficiens]|jgi:hypothetical protein|nr:hypothetical protein [Bradyrhizobium diazoefficiens]MBR0812759.1 hypothetical protein [Bradyrhizobium diazoefficiens]
MPLLYTIEAEGCVTGAPHLAKNASTKRVAAHKQKGRHKAGLSQREALE